MMQSLRSWQQDLVDLLMSEDRPPVIVVNMPGGAGKTWAKEHLPSEMARHYNTGLEAVGVDALANEADLMAAVAGHEFVFVDDVDARTAPAVMAVLRVLIEEEVTLVVLGEDCAPLVDAIDGLPGLRMGLIASFPDLERELRRMRLQPESGRLAWMIFEIGGA